jgi:hypothetical protein
MRRQDTSEYNWMHMYRNELVYFKSIGEKKTLVDESKKRLDIRGATRLSQLMEQLTDRENIGNKKHSQPVWDITNETRHLRGHSLGMMLETSKQRIQDIESKIEGIGQTKRDQYGIKNPKFPNSKQEIQSMFAPVFGVAYSDGHISRKRKAFIYSESNRERVDIFNKQVDRFGNVHRTESVRPNGVIRTHYSSTFGRLLETCGMTSGDKTLQNEGWSDFLKRFPPEALPPYYSALWAEDGNFNYQKANDRASFQVERGVVLRDPSKSKNYGLIDRASNKHSKFVREHGDEREDDAFGRLFRLRTGSLKELEESLDIETSRIAKELRTIIDSNKPKLMIDEQEGLRLMGIETKEYFVYLTFSEKTGRLSALWHYETRTKDDAMRVCLKCPPKDQVKREKVEKWMNSESESDRKERIRHEIEEDSM